MSESKQWGQDGYVNGERLRELAEQLLKRQSMVLLLHQSPDGDSVGASLSLARALRQKGKKTQVAYADYLPEQFQYLPGYDELVHWTQLKKGYDTVVLCDCSKPDRVGDAQVLVHEAPYLVNIDHHPDNPDFGDVHFVDAHAAAVGEIIYELLPYLEATLTPDIAEALYLAIFTDTGGFRYDNTTPVSHRIAAELIAAGVDVARVTREVYENKPDSAFRVLALALQSLKRHDTLPVAWIVLTRRDLDEAEARPEDTDTVVNYARSLKGVEVAFLIREEEPNDNKVSLRSQRKIDVGHIAAQLGGGGHARAAGCRVSNASPGVARDRVLAVIERRFKELSRR